MLRIISRQHAAGSAYVSMVRDDILCGVVTVYEVDGKPSMTECGHCAHGTRCAHAAIVRRAAEAVAAARAQSSMGVQP